ncbi:Rmf/CrpP fold protein [Streptomyces sp. Edi2]|uniref:Rmf/CrpP fold protein n=1 Tax=Streptomyces sp. Edi2 TaxID=3162528 RepID=UPI003306127E
MGPKEQAVEAILKGAEAGETGQPVTVCPYPRASLLRRAWIKGYAQSAKSSGTATSGLNGQHDGQR